MLVKCFFWQRQDLGEDLPFRFFYMQQYTGQLQCQPPGRRRSGKLEMGLWSGPTTAVQSPERGKSQPLPSSGGRGARSYCLRIESTAPPDTRGGRAQRLVAAPAAVCLSLSLLPCAVPSPLFRAGLREPGGAERASQAARRRAHGTALPPACPVLGEPGPDFVATLPDGGARLPSLAVLHPQMQIVVGTHQHL